MAESCGPTGLRSEVKAARGAGTQRESDGKNRMRSLRTLFPPSRWLTPRLRTAGNGWGAQELKRFQLLHNAKEPESEALGRSGVGWGGSFGTPPGLLVETPERPSQQQDADSSTTLAVLTLNVNGLNTPVKKTKTVTSD